MRFGQRVGTVLVMLVVAAQAGQDRTQCRELDAYVNAAKTKFTSLRGKNEDGIGISFRPTVNLPGASSCSINDLDEYTEAECNYLFLSEADRSQGRKDIEGAIEKCAGVPSGKFGKISELGYRGNKNIDITIRPVHKF